MARRIMIVGNGEIPQGMADFIDLSDMVIRFNDCRSVGPGGRRTDIVAVCNTGRPGKAMAEGDGWRRIDAVRQASAIWSVRDPAKFAEMEPDILEKWPELDDFCADYSAGFAAIADQTGKDHVVIPRAIHEQMDAALQAYSPEPYVCPSSGMIAIAHVLEENGTAGDNLALAGFGHEGWSGHPFVAERQLVDALINQGRLTRISNLSIFSASQGA